MAPTYHPKPDNHGHPVKLSKPSTPTPLETWSNPAQVATVTPEGPMPDELNGIRFAPWTDHPRSAEAWNGVDGQADIEEPPFKVAPGKKAAAGVIIEEADGRVWVVHPSNRFAGYSATFPKGTADAGASLQATAIKEAYEESGLRVQITAFLADSERSQSTTRYYMARRLGGNPGAMGWESQAVSLVPRGKLGEVLTHINDAAQVEALQTEQRPVWGVRLSN